MSAHYDLLIRGATLVSSEDTQRSDLAVAGGKIAAIGVDLDGTAQDVIQGEQHFLLPGYIDAHVHLNEPGREEWEGFATGTAALAAGGCTCFVDMPLNSTPVLDGASFEAKAKALAEHSRLNGALWGGLTPLNLDRLGELAECGVVGFKAFMSNSGIDDFPHSDLKTLRQGMAQAAALRLPVAVHAEDDALTSQLAAEAQAAGRCSARDYLDSRPVQAELQAIGDALALARDTGCALHIVHVSSAAGLQLVAKGRRAGIDVTAETCPHYLLLEEKDVIRLGAPAKCAPPLRSAREREQLWQALTEGLVDTIGSDHSPSPPDMKFGEDFFKIWGGIAGAQHNYPLLLEEALQRQVPLSLIVRLTSLNVARRFGLANKGDLRVGWDADLVMVNSHSPHEIVARDLLTRHPLSAYLGRKTNFAISSTISAGRIIHGADSTTKPHPAQILRPTSL